MFAYRLRVIFGSILVFMESLKQLSSCWRDGSCVLKNLCPNREEATAVWAPHSLRMSAQCVWSAIQKTLVGLHFTLNH